MCLFSIYISPCEYLIHLLVAHTTSKTLLNSVHVIVCWVLWPSKIKLLDVFNALIKVRKFVIVEFLFEKFGFEDHLKSWTFMLYIKTVFKMILQKKFLEFFKISLFEIQPIETIFRLIKLWRRKMAFLFKSLRFPWFLPINRACFHVYFNSCSIPLDRSNFEFYKHIGIRFEFFKRTFHLSLQFLSWSLLSNLFSIFLFYFCCFCGQRFKGFLHTLKVRLFYPFFFIILHDYMYFSWNF